MSLPTIAERKLKQQEVARFLESLNLREINFRHIEDGASLEIVDIDRDKLGRPIVNGNPPFYYDFPFIALRPDGGKFPYPVRMNRNSRVSDGAVIVPVLEHAGAYYVVAVRQYRFPLQRWTLEFPRGFPEKDSGAAGETFEVPGMGHLKTKPILREVYEEAVKANLAPSEVTHLGRIEENSSTHLVAPDFVLAIFTVEDDVQSAIGGEENLPVVLLSPEEVDNRLGAPGPDGINDLHSVAAWGLARKLLAASKTSKTEE